jgi:hypothetical protein
MAFLKEILPLKSLKPMLNLKQILLIKLTLPLAQILSPKLKRSLNLNSETEILKTQEKIRKPPFFQGPAEQNCNFE